MSATNSQQSVVWINGEYVDSNNVSFSATDPGLTIGLGVFDSLCGYAGKPFDYPKHYTRLAAGASRLGLEVPDCDVMLLAISGVIERNGFQSTKCRLRVTLLAGDKQQKSMVSVAKVPVRGEFSRVQLSPYRVNELSPLAGIKSTSYAMNMIALREASQQGADEALFLNSKGELCEGATSNVFLVSEGVVFTPTLKSGCLPGVARDTVLELCSELGIETSVGDLSLTGLKNADEVFLTSSLREVQAVERIDGCEVKTVAGPLVRSLMKAYQERTNGSN